MNGTTAEPKKYFYSNFYCCVTKTMKWPKSFCVVCKNVKFYN